MLSLGVGLPFGKGSSRSLTLDLTLRLDLNLSMDRGRGQALGLSFGGESGLGLVVGFGCGVIRPVSVPYSMLGQAASKHNLESNPNLKARLLPQAKPGVRHRSA